MTDSVANGRVRKFIVDFSPAELEEGETLETVHLYDVAGNPTTVPGVGVAVADISTVDATDATSAATLANVNKAKINALLASLRAAGIIASA